MLPLTLAIFIGNDQFPMNGDAEHKFKQNSTFYWLTGIEQPGSLLLLFPSATDAANREILVLEKPEELKEKWEGKRLRATEATAISGIGKVVWSSNFDALLQSLVHASEGIYLNTNENDRRSNQIRTLEYRFIDEIKERFPLHVLHRAAPIIKELRAVKSSLEIEVIKQAIAITKKAFDNVCLVLRPGVMEFVLEAEIVHAFLSNRASGEAYGSIVASGDRARTLHYTDNNGVCEDGEMVLMDFGACFGGYNADLTRTLPVNGTFSPRQKELYDACLHLHDFAKSLLKPGVTLEKCMEAIADEATETFIKVGLLTQAEVDKEDKNNRAYRKYLYHGVSHHLGVDVHDLGPRDQPLRSGMVLTVEPGIYVEAEKIGIRIENNVVITEDGYWDLMADFPITTEQIERAMSLF